MASSKAVYDVIVIGAGIEGSASAYTLSKEGKKVLLLEQVPFDYRFNFGEFEVEGRLAGLQRSKKERDFKSFIH